MATKKQHFVPRVYLKAWETKVETKKNRRSSLMVFIILKKEILLEKALHSKLFSGNHICTRLVLGSYTWQKSAPRYTVFLLTKFLIQ